MGNSLAENRKRRSDPRVGASLEEIVVKMIFATRASRRENVDNFNGYPGEPVSDPEAFYFVCCECSWSSSVQEAFSHRRPQQAQVCRPPRAPYSSIEMVQMTPVTRNKHRVMLKHSSEPINNIAIAL